MINVAIIGTGGISHAHIQGYLELSNRCKITALVDIDTRKASEKAKKYNLDVDIYSNYKDILNRTDIDIVDICTPPYVHSKIAIDILNSAKNVLVEKPMASSLEECDAMIEAAQKNKRLLSVVAQNRLRNGYMKLKKTLDSGLIGNIVHVQADSFWWRGHCYYDLWWRGTWEKEGGGCTLNHAVHHIDIIAWLTGMPEEINAVISNAAHSNAEVEDISIAILKYKNGALGQITSSVVHHGEEQQIILQGKNARISVPWKVCASKSMNNGFPEENEKLEKEIQAYFDKLPEIKYEGHTGQIDDILTSLESGKQILINGEDGKNALEIITSIYKSSITKQPVKLPITKDDTFYTVKGIQANAPHFYEKTSNIIDFNNDNITLGRNL